MKPALIALLALTYALAHAAEWLCYGGDPQRSGWQRREKDLNTLSVRRLKLLWKRQLDNQSKGLNSLTAPTLLGPIFTHRGVKELVIIAGASDNVYAVDADLGKVFWKRHFDSTAPQDPHAEWPCGAGLTATPAIAPPASKIQNDEEASTPLRPIYALSSDGRLHKIRPTDGEDMAPAVPFTPMNANSSNLNLVGRSIYTTTSGGCGDASDGVWSIDVSSPRPKAGFSPSNDGSVPPVPFTWKGRIIRAAASREGRVFLLDGDSAASTTLTGSLATWEDAKGNRWIYAAGRSGIVAFMLSGEASRPELSRLWSRTLEAPLSPVIAGGVLFVLAGGSKSTHATLYALDAVTGKELYSSGSAVTSFTPTGGLAIANGHVCFGAWDNTLYCFGLPIEI